LELTNAVNVHIKGLDLPQNPYTAVLFNADTTEEKHQAKIVNITSSHEKDKENGDIEVLIFWDAKTKYFPFDVFAHFHSVQTLHINRPFSGMASPKNGHFLHARKLQRIFITNQSVCYF
jgi:hypothetical protein